MDRFIKRFDAIADDDLILCRENGVAYQADMTPTAEYDEAYFGKCRSYEDKEIARAINAGRAALVAKHYGPGPALDIGVGSGEFVRNRPLTFGYDINPAARRWLLECGFWAEDVESFSAITMWDVVEHVPEPESYFSRIKSGARLFVSVPIFTDLDRIRESRHYRPGEHLLYFTERGFVDWMELHGFSLLERQTFEIDAGRDSIFSFALEKQ